MSEETYIIVNDRTGQPIRNHLGDPITAESKEAAKEKASRYTSGNEDDFRVKKEDDD